MGLTRNALKMDQQMLSPPKIRKKQVYLLLPLLIYILLEGLADVSKQEKEIKGIQFGWEEMKLP